jgi:hypothetical protein
VRVFMSAENGFVTDVIIRQCVKMFARAVRP